MQYIDFVITQSSLDNGRIYFEASQKDFFPAESIGGRGAHEHAATQVHIDAAGDLIETDIRISSAVRISPRKSFRAWLRSQQAVDGGKARLHLVSEGSYKLEYLG